MKSFLKSLVPTPLRDELRQFRGLEPAARWEWARRRLARLAGRPTAERLPAIGRPAPLVVFLCHGNLYRSPIAAAAFAREAERLAPGAIRVRSAGLRTAGGREAPEDARRVAEELGVSLSAHRAAPLTSALAEEADLLVVMDRANEATVARRHPAAAGKVVLLGAFARSDGTDGAVIADPYGRGIEEVRRCFGRIEGAARAIAHALLPDAPALPAGHERRPHGPARRVLRHLLASDPLTPLWRPFAAGDATVLMLHRFADPERGVRGHDPELLARNLEFLRKQRFHLESLEGLIERLAAGEPPRPRTVVFTIDDGYGDVARVGAPVFARYDCPATVFVVTGFVDGDCWLWYDAVRYLLGPEPRGALELPVGSVRLRLRWASDPERESLATRLNEALKRVPSAQLEEAVSRLAEVTGRSLPRRPTARFAPMSWEEARQWSARGMSFGPHTHTHPILSRAEEPRIATEIRQSWERVRAEVPTAVPVFCYPNGMPDDFGTREMRLVEEAGLRGAVAAHGGPCGLGHFRRQPFALPRQAYEEDPIRFRQVVGGMERAARLARRLVRP